MTYSIETNDIVFYCNGNEMLKITQNGFYVRGKQIKQDDQEAEKVYNSFKEWLVWQSLQRHL